MLLDGLKLGILAIFVVICLSYSSSTPLFAEEEVKWIIEDEHIISESKENHTTIKSDHTDELELSILKIHEGNFVSGNKYYKDGNEISSTSVEGQNINELLVKQKEQMRENWLHKIQYYDRYDDGYIELAEALLDPVGDLEYVINGQKFDTNPNSNLEYFLRERGFDINDPSSIPNDVFRPAKYVDARNILKEDGHYKGVDLGEVADYYKPLSEQDIQAILIEDITKHTITLQENVIGQITSKFESNPGETTNKEINRINDSLFADSIGGGDIFQNTKHIIQSPIVGVTTDLEPDYNIISILGIAITALSLAIVGYYIWKKRILLPPKKILLPAIITEVDITGLTLEMITQSLKLLDDDKKKEAHEKLSQAIRYYYSNKIGIQKEVNSSELVQLLKDQKLIDSIKIKSWLEFCGLVEFAKQEVNNAEFHRIISLFKRELE